MVYAFILAGMHLIGFMPNAHIATTPYFRIKVFPRGIMQPLPILCISFKMFKRPPILYDSAETKFGAEKSCFITAFCFELIQHFRHCPGDRQPFMYFPEFIDPHTDKKDDKITFQFYCHALVDCFCHRKIFAVYSVLIK